MGATVPDACQSVAFTYDVRTIFDVTTGNDYVWGHLTGAYWGGGCTAGEFAEQYIYLQSGLPWLKRLKFTKSGKTGKLDSFSNWDNEGRLTWEKYPNDTGTTEPFLSPEMNYDRDAMGRVTGIRRAKYLTAYPAAPTYVQVADTLTYNGAGQLASMNWLGRSLTNTYNVLGQLTRSTSAGSAAFDEEYVYSATANNGRITQKKDYTAAGGTEIVNYTYDSLNRLTLAETGATGPQWGQSFSYDGFGNLGAKAMTKGTLVPTMEVGINAARNRLAETPFVYDDNGNLTRMPDGTGTIDLTYDVENRLARNGAGGELSYGPDNRRVWDGTAITFWSVAGYRVGRYQPTDNGSSWTFTTLSTSIYMGGRLIGEGGAATQSVNFVPVVNDRLGSVRVRDTQRYSYFPYGEEMGTTANGVDKFGTYRREDFGNKQIDYADQRYFQSIYGRFLTPDPYRANPGSWNRYAYVEEDPVNWRDPTGLQQESSPDPGSEIIYCSFLGTFVPRENCPRGYPGDHSPEVQVTKELPHRDLDLNAAMRALLKDGLDAMFKTRCGSVFNSVGISKAAAFSTGVDIDFYNAAPPSPYAQVRTTSRVMGHQPSWLTVAWPDLTPMSLQMTRASLTKWS